MSNYNVNIEIKHKMEQQLIENTMTNMKNELAKYFDNVDYLLSIINEEKYSIAGGFMLACFGHPPDSTTNYWGKPIYYSDIDIYIKDPFNMSDFVEHKLYDFLIECNFKKLNLCADISYVTDDNIKSSYFILDVEGKPNVNINIITLRKNSTESTLDYIMQMFDLECCKIVYNCEQIHIASIENLIRSKSQYQIDLDLHIGTDCMSRIYISDAFRCCWLYWLQYNNYIDDLRMYNYYKIKKNTFRPNSDVDKLEGECIIQHWYYDTALNSIKVDIIRETISGDVYKYQHKDGPGFNRNNIDTYNETLKKIYTASKNPIISTELIDLTYCEKYLVFLRSNSTIDVDQCFYETKQLICDQSINYNLDKFY